jgi:hypothetical protein
VFQICSLSEALREAKSRLFNDRAHVERSVLRMFSTSLLMRGEVISYSSFKMICF